MQLFALADMMNEIFYRGSTFERGCHRMLWSMLTASDTNEMWLSVVCIKVCAHLAIIEALVVNTYKWNKTLELPS